jgi:hypothetical protein
MITCDSKCGFLGIGGKRCKAIRDCVCAGGNLAAIDLNLQEAWRLNCQTYPDSRDVDAFLCDKIGGEALATRYEAFDLAAKCGYNPFKDSPQAEKEKETQDRLDNQTATNNKLTYMVLLLVACLIAWFALK